MKQRNVVLIFDEAGSHLTNKVQETLKEVIKYEVGLHLIL